jgi:hypothetical protein
MEKDYLTLKRAAPTRPSGEWKDDDYDVLADGTIVGRICNAGLSVARQPATLRHARPPWQRLPRAGGANSPRCLNLPSTRPAAPCALGRCIDA